MMRYEGGAYSYVNNGYEPDRNKMAANHARNGGVDWTGSTGSLPGLINYGDDHNMRSPTSSKQPDPSPATSVEDKLRSLLVDDSEPTYVPSFHRSPPDGRHHTYSSDSDNPQSNIAANKSNMAAMQSNMAAKPFPSVQRSQSYQFPSQFGWMPSVSGERVNREAVAERPTRVVNPTRVRNKNESASNQMRETYVQYYGGRGQNPPGPSSPTRNPASGPRPHPTTTNQPGLQYQNYGPIDAFSNYATYPNQSPGTNSHLRQNSDPRRQPQQGSQVPHPSQGQQGTPGASRPHRSPAQSLVQRQRDNRVNGNDNPNWRGVDHPRNPSFSADAARSPHASESRYGSTTRNYQDYPKSPGIRGVDYVGARVQRKDYEIILGPELRSNRAEADGQSVTSPAVSPDRGDSRRSLTPTRQNDPRRDNEAARNARIQQHGHPKLIQRPAQSVQDLRDYEELKRLSQEAKTVRESPPRSSSASICRPGSLTPGASEREGAEHDTNTRMRRSSSGHHVTFRDDGAKSTTENQPQKPELERTLQQYTSESLHSTRNYIEMKPTKLSPRSESKQQNKSLDNYYKMNGATKTYNVDDAAIAVVLDHNRSHDPTPGQSENNSRNYESTSFMEKLEDPFSNDPSDPSFVVPPDHLYKSGGIMKVSGSEPSSQSITPPLPSLDGNADDRHHKPRPSSRNKGSSRLPTGDAYSDDDDDIISTDTQQDHATDATRRQTQLPRPDHQEDLQTLRKQLDGLETMYHEVLKLLNVDRDYVLKKPQERTRKRRPVTAGSSSSSSTFKTRSKDIKNVARRFTRLESHVVTLARSVAHLSNEMRAHNMLYQEMEALKHELTMSRDQGLRVGQGTCLPGTSSRPNSNQYQTTDWERQRSWVPALTNPRRVEKLKRFFGQEPPLLALFLKTLGYEKYLSNFESEHITMVELPYLTEPRLQSIGIPLGPRLRILQEARIAFKNDNNFNVYIV